MKNLHDPTEPTICRLYGTASTPMRHRVARLIDKQFCKNEI